jgi:IS1 family transposase
MRPGPLWGKKDKHCDPTQAADRDLGSWWDHVLLDTDSRLIVTLVVGRRTLETLRLAWQDYYERTDGALPGLIVTDEYAAYFTVIVDLYGVGKDELELAEAEQAAVGYDAMPAVYFPVEINYATVHKEREQGRVVEVDARVVLGSAQQVKAVLTECDTAQSINVSYVERSHGTQRHFNARKARKVYTFSKELVFHIAVTWLVVTNYNWCWAVRTLRVQEHDDPPRYRQRTPAQAASLTAEPWTLQQVFSYPIYRPPTAPPKRKRRRRKTKRTEGR